MPSATIKVAPMALRKPRRAMAPRMSPSLRSSGNPLAGGSEYVSRARLQNLRCASRSSADDPTNVRAQDRQQFRLEPGIALEPCIVPPGGMGQGHEARMAVRAIDLATASDRFAEILAGNLRAEMPLLRIFADEQ